MLALTLKMYQTVIRTNFLCDGSVSKWDFHDLKYVGLVPDLGKFLLTKRANWEDSR